MIRSGLVSVSFRKLSPEEIISAAAEAGLKGIEWGGDIHVPHGDLARAAVVLRSCRSANLAVSAYGSYYRAGATGPDHPSFQQVLDTALALETDTIRIWAGPHGSEGLAPEQRQIIVDDLKRVCDLAQRRQLSVSLEYHGGTLTDTNESAQRLVSEVAHSNLRLYWQPPLATTREYRLDGLRAALPLLTNLHVFWWQTANGVTERLDLAAGEAFWTEVFALVSQAGGNRYACLEFFRGDDLVQFRADAAVLRRLLKED